MSNQEHELDAIHLLLEGLRAGNTDAQAQMLENYGEIIVRFLVRIYRIPQTEAEDIAVETLYRAIGRIDTFIERPNNGQNGFRNWLFTIARNLWLSHQRNQPSISHFESVENLAAPNFAAQPASSLSKHSEIVHEALTNLPDNQRLTLIMHYNGLSLSEVAQLLSVPPGTVRQWKQRGLAALTRLLKSDPTFNQSLAKVAALIEEE